MGMLLGVFLEEVLKEIPDGTLEGMAREQPLSPSVWDPKRMVPF